MSADIKYVNVVDVEATCWETKEEQGTRPNEVIEIGICRLNLRDDTVDMKTSYVVKPKFTEVSPFCTSLTGWHPDMINNAGMSIEEALERVALEHRMNNRSVWFSCGQYDRVKLGSVGSGSLLDLYGIPYSINPFAQAQHFNVKTLFALKHRLKKEMGMARMIAHIGETIEGRHHNGADDAWNIAKLVRNVLS